MGTSLRIVSGISTHLQQILQSPLTQKFQFQHFETGGQGKNELFLMKLWRYIFSPLMLFKTILQIKPKVIHLNTSMDPKAFWRDTAYLLVSKILRRKVIFQVHGGKLPQEFYMDSVFLTIFLKWILGWPEVLVVLSDRELQAYIQFLSARKIELIPNAIDLSPYSKAVEKNFTGQELRLVYLGALTESKGILETLEAIAGLKAMGKLSFIKYIIAGSGKIEYLLKQQVTRLGLQELVEFVGTVFEQEKVNFWLTAHLFIFPSYNEGLPYTLLESMASGTPVIATPVGGIPEVIQDGVHGALLEPKDSAAIGSAISRLIQQPDLLKKMSLKCIDRAREKYGIERMVGQFEALYELLLRGE